ncbi:MAG: hypothetical protein ACD_48C00064G0001, partial [uncultured bacterium]
MVLSLGTLEYLSFFTYTFEYMQTILTIAQMILGILLIIVILLQQKGAGIGAAFGGGGGIESTRRGSDLVLFRATIGISLVFFLLSLA